LREIFEHTADAGIRIESQTLTGAFNELSLAITEVITGGNLVDSSRDFDITLESSDLVSLLVKYISHLIYLFDTENFLVSHTAFRLEAGTSKKLVGKLHGELYDQNKHGYGVEIKAVSYHMLEISEGPPSRIVVILDL
tara:strand:- start:259 stop:672 length:414 start_codon:yes stop_codon:yes gene_type:complete